MNKLIYAMSFPFTQRGPFRVVEVGSVMAVAVAVARRIAASIVARWAISGASVLASLWYG